MIPSLSSSHGGAFGRSVEARIGSPIDDVAFSVSLERHRVGASAPDSALEGARELVAIALVQPALASLREHSQAAEPFAPTTAEKQFGAILDARRAQEIVRAKGFPLVDAVAARLGGVGRTLADG